MGFNWYLAWKYDSQYSARISHIFVGTHISIPEFLRLLGKAVLSP